MSTTTHTTEHYPSHSLADAPRADDGYYGPDSVSWRVFSDPGSSLGAQIAVFLQMLDAGMKLAREAMSSGRAITTLDALRRASHG